MKVQNKSKRAYQHGEFKLLPGSILEVSEEVAAIWLKTGEVVEYVAPAEAKAIEAENAKLKAEIEELKKATEKESVPEKETAPKKEQKKKK